MQASKLIIFFTLFLAPGVYAEESPNDRINELNQQIELAISNLVLIEAKLGSVRKELEEREHQIAELRSEEARLQSELEKLTQAKGGISSEMSELERKQEELNKTSARRLRVSYMIRPSDAYQKLLAVRTSADLGRRAFLLARVRQFDKSLLDSWSADLGKLEEKRKELEAILEEQQILADQVADRRQAIASEVQERQKLSKELESDKKKKGEAVAALRAQSLRLETVVVSITGGNRDDAEGRHANPPVKRGSAGQEPEGELAGFSGPGLAALKQELVLPLQGKIVQPFGKQKLIGFEEMVFHKGIEFLGDSGADIKAIAPGQVIFQGRMPGYGTMLILDHGKRYYSLYGRINELKRNKGDKVLGGDILGHTGDADEKGRNFYFEIRKEGTALNPESLFGKRFK